ncbi:DUF547 domain-containing protein [Flavobacteriaceae bacterium]|nr:DUF547 domain-containing protein [Flavobacteriaceae bacterium]
MNVHLIYALIAVSLCDFNIPKEPPTQRNIHFRWQQQLEAFVSADGNVDYKGWKNQEQELEAYIGTLEQFTPAAYWSKEEILAYWINAYNALTVQLILKNYPLKSIRDIKDPWDTPCFFLSDKKYSLGNIEHDILRKMDEPRIHFAINCASTSCPKLQREAFMPRKMEVQLENATKAFVMDQSKNKISKEELKLSRIFLWFGKDFGSKAARLTFISRYSGVDLKNPTIEYLSYDWSLNQ